ncbi:MAG: apolipoprotein N-acyltransferase, partial [Candidatus Margulisiibacteriota bacterium]
RLALIQPNIDQIDKMDVYKISATFALQEDLSRQAAGNKPDVIIWPETAVFSYMVQDPLLFPRLRQLAKDAGCWILCGTPYLQDGKAYNSVIALSPSGEIVSRYDKEHLVPFGEYLPFRPLLYPLLKTVGYYDSEFLPGTPRLLEFAGYRAATGICFESTFPALIKKRVQQGADFILVVTNDAWFGDSSAPYFHLNTSILRAIENRKYVIQVGNSGISAVIDPCGRIIKQSNLNQREIIFSTLSPAN